MVFGRPRKPKHAETQKKSSGRNEFQKSSGDCEEPRAATEIGPSFASLCLRVPLKSIPL